jgi:hypothetical protein
MWWSIARWRWLECWNDDRYMYFMYAVVEGLYENDSNVHLCRFCARMNLSPNDRSHVALLIHLMRTDHDDCLVWPFLDVSLSCLWMPGTRTDMCATQWCHVQNWGHSSVHCETWTHVGLGTQSLCQCLICPPKDLWHQMIAFSSNCKFLLSDLECTCTSQIIHG